ncbi:MAG: YihY/virulence factor BrkB family protein [Gammaproteobacteria bacterium]|nr:YihY/virulence factor BrkB family protein [Gammaproteobacteria bacterium]
MGFNIKSLDERVTDYIWDRPIDTMPKPEQLAITTLRIVHLIIRDISEGQVNLRAMGLVYTTLLAMVPLIAVSFSVLKGFGVHNQVEPMLLGLLEPLGEKGVEITERVIGFVDNINVTVLGSLGVALLFYTVVSLMQKIERAFNDTWRVTELRPFAQRFSDYLTVILIGPVLMFTALGVTASIGNIALVKSAMEVEAIGAFMQLAGRLVPFLLVVGAFTFVYVFVPNTRVTVRAAAIGALAAALMWQIMGWGFATFVANSTKYTAIYAAFATMLILLIWLYFSWLILLIGGSIAFYVQHPEHRNLQSRIIRISNRMREKMALLIMGLVGQHYYHQRPPWSLEGLAKHMNVGSDACGLLVSSLEQSGLLVRTSDNPPTYLPGHALETLKLKDIINTVRSTGETAYLSPGKLPQTEAVDNLYQEIERAIDTSLETRTLLDLSIAEPTKVVPMSDATSKQAVEHSETGTTP